MSKQIFRRGISVVIAGTGINLALGVLYAWSIFKGAINKSIETGGPGAFTWDIAALNDPYAVCCLVFACSMIFAGRCQDRLGPRPTAIIGAVLVGLGFVWISQSTSYLVWILGFGGLVGMGIAFGYASATPPALKWFPPSRSGLVAGIVVSGFGLASVYIAPLGEYLLGVWGLSGAMLFFGLAFLLVVSLLALLLVNPPASFKPEQTASPTAAMGKAQAEPAPVLEEVDFTPGEMIKTGNFWRIWFLYFIGAGAGLMVIGSVAGMAKSSMGAKAFFAVAILAIGNAAGRIIAGSLADRFGCSRTLVGVFAFQALLMFIAIPVVGAQQPNALLLVGVATFIGLNYGANLALFPALVKGLWGMRHFGVNYGTVFTAWGLGGFVMSKFSQALKADTGSFTTSFATAGVFLIVGVCFIIFMPDE